MYIKEVGPNIKRNVKMTNITKGCKSCCMPNIQLSLLGTVKMSFGCHDVLNLSLKNVYERLWQAWLL